MNETLKGTIDRALLVGITWGLTWLATKGYIGDSDVAALAPALVLVIGTAIAYFVNTPKATVKAAAKIDAPVKTIAKEITEARAEMQPDPVEVARKD